MTQTDLTFITNEENKCLLVRFKTLIKDTRLFNVLVGYFFTSGFHALYQSLEPTEKIRVLIGISTDKETAERIQRAKRDEQLEMKFSHKEAKDKFGDSVESEMESSEDNPSVEDGVNKFIDWLRRGKLEIRAYPTANIHAKLYIMTFAEGDRDRGRVITGSSNFTQAGLRENLEFNVELKNPSDYDFALAKFNELWRDAVDVKDQYIEVIRTRTWLNDTITPQELYLKFLYEYFKDDLRQSEELFYKYVPEDFKKLLYQEQAVLNAKKILEEYGGVFVSDVVGLGKTYISAMLAQQLEGRTLVIAPPVLLKKENPGSWPNVFFDFRVSAEFESLGKLDHLIKRGTEKYKNVIIDEAHRFRTESNVTYEKLAQICRGKRVILVTATPYNNRPQDILSQIKLFQKAKRSTIPNLPNLEAFFNALQKRLKPLDRQADYSEYVKVVKENAKEIREKVLKYLMVRRTRAEIVRYFTRDLEEQKLKFPDVADPEAIFYQLGEEEDRIFTHTIDLVANKFKYARYKPLLYYKGADQPDQLERQSQENMGRFMKILLVKRLESSFYAFKNTIGRFITSYQRFLEELDKGFVYVSKKYTSKIFELLENDDEAEVQRLIDEGKAERYPAKEFTDEFKRDLKHDLAILLEVEKLWQNVSRDPKLLALKDKLASTAILKSQQLIIFTESKETAEYLCRNLETVYPDKVLCYTGGSSAIVREKVIENFDARARFRKDDYRILISTEVLSEGVNLHRSNVVINYDIPWNPTRMMQRVGRINRVDTGFDKIYSFNFFPTKQSNDQIKLKEAAEAKIHAFISLLGADARLLTEGEPIESHELFSRLISKKTITGEDDGEESELKYLQVIKDVRDNHLDLFERIKRLPKKARTARVHPGAGGFLVTYFRKGKVQKFFQASTDGEPAELDFLSAAKLLEAAADVKRESVKKDYYQLLDRNKEAFKTATSEEILEAKTQGGRDSAARVLRILKAKEIRKYQGYTDEDELYFQRVINELEAGGIPEQTAKTLSRALDEDEELKKGPQPLRILALLKLHIADEFLTDNAPTAARTAGPREVILSEYFVSK